MKLGNNPVPEHLLIRKTSDFIKVNYENGWTKIYPKKELQLEDNGKEYFVYSLSSAILLVAACSIESSIQAKCYMWQNNNNKWRVTFEEYDRLCKELGVE